MKQILYILTALFMIAGCGPDDPQTEAVKLSVDKTSLEFTAEGGDQIFTVTASEQVYIVPGENWLKFKKGVMSSDYKTSVTITAEANPATEARQTRISVVAGEEKHYVDVVQAAAEKRSLYILYGHLSAQCRLK